MVKLQLIASQSYTRVDSSFLFQFLSIVLIDTLQTPNMSLELYFHLLGPLVMLHRTSSMVP